MVHPIFSVLISRPELIVDHLSAYASLTREEATTVSGEVLRRAIAWVLALLSFVVFLALAGVAAMLGAMHDEFHWMLVAAPGTALAISVISLAFAMRRFPEPAFEEVRAQFHADALALRNLGVKS